MVCRICAGHFEENELQTMCDRVPYGEGYAECETALCCPVCGSEYVCEEVRCEGCSQETPESDLCDGLCRVCVEETQQELAWMWGMLSSSQKRFAKNNPAWMEE